MNLDDQAWEEFVKRFNLTAAEQENAEACKAAKASFSFARIRLGIAIKELTKEIIKVLRGAKE